MSKKSPEKNNALLDLDSMKELRDGYKTLQENERSRVDKKSNKFKNLLKYAALIGITVSAIAFVYYANTKPGKQKNDVRDTENKVVEPNNNTDVDKTVEEVLQEKEYVTEKTNKVSNSTKPDLSDKTTNTRKDSKEQVKNEKEDATTAIEHEDNTQYKIEIDKKAEEAKDKGQVEKINVEGEDVKVIIDETEKVKPPRTEGKGDIDKDSAKDAIAKEENNNNKIKDDSTSKENIQATDDNSLEAMLKMTEKTKANEDHVR